jgi:hypothetical protein
MIRATTFEIAFLHRRASLVPAAHASIAPAKLRCVKRAATCPRTLRILRCSSARLRHAFSPARSRLALTLPAVASSILQWPAFIAHADMAQAIALLAILCTTRMPTSYSLRCSLTLHAQPRSADPSARLHMHLQICDCTLSMCRCPSALHVHASQAHASPLLRIRCATFRLDSRIRRCSRVLLAHVANASPPPLLRIRSTIDPQARVRARRRCACACQHTKARLCIACLSLSTTLPASRRSLRCSAAGPAHASHAPRSALLHIHDTVRMLFCRPRRSSFTRAAHDASAIAIPLFLILATSDDSARRPCRSAKAFIAHVRQPHASSRIVMCLASLQHRLLSRPSSAALVAHVASAAPSALSRKRLATAACARRSLRCS